MIVYENKDITTVEKGIIAHGVNAQKVMNKGVAKAIRNKWPIVYERYMAMPKGSSMLGESDVIKVGSDLYVANCYTQEFYGDYQSIAYARPELILESLSVVFNFSKLYDVDVYMPKIGCGLGGLDWDGIVLPLVERLESKIKPNKVVVCWV